MRVICLWERAFYQRVLFFLGVKNCEGSIAISPLRCRSHSGDSDGKSATAISIKQTHPAHTSQGKSDLGQLVPAINTLPLGGIEIFRRVRFCPGGYGRLLSKSKELFAKYKFRAVNFSLWKSRPETVAIPAAIGVRCEDNLYRPAVDGHFPLVATPALHRPILLDRCSRA